MGKFVLAHPLRATVPVQSKTQSFFEVSQKRHLISFAKTEPPPFDGRKKERFMTTQISYEDAFEKVLAENS
jgi:hypothetical protein